MSAITRWDYELHTGMWALDTGEWVRFEDAEAAIKAAVEAAREWQPIETAPKEGVSRIDLYGVVGKKGKRVPNCYWHRKAGQWMTDCHDKDGFSFLRLPFKPTHWMPLPEPPKGPEQ
jgi:hypothetical protein